MDPTELTPEEQHALREQRRVERMFKFVHGHRVRYDEIDAQGVVGSGSWMNLLHLARVEYLRSLGLFMEGGRTPVQLIVRRATLEFLAPARFDDAVIFRVRCAQLGNSSAQFEYLVDNGDELRLLIAQTVIACVDMATFRAADWPLVFRERVQEIEGENLQVGQLIR
jgi:acyl-CoA thioester hydrolase